MIINKGTYEIIGLNPTFIQREKTIEHRLLLLNVSNMKSLKSVLFRHHRLCKNEKQLTIKTVTI